jgi:drug/metabolite transporter (DMT)-like permease
MLALGERPGPSEWTALSLVVAAIAIVLWPPHGAPQPMAPDD